MNINATLIGQAIWFGLFIWITMKFVWPPLQKAMADRQAQIADGLAAAERGKHEPPREPDLGASRRESSRARAEGIGRGQIAGISLQAREFSEERTVSRIRRTGALQ